MKPRFRKSKLGYLYHISYTSSLTRFLTASLSPSVAFLHIMDALTSTNSHHESVPLRNKSERRQGKKDRVSFLCVSTASLINLESHSSSSIYEGRCEHFFHRRNEEFRAFHLHYALRRNTRILFKRFPRVRHYG